MSDGANKVDGEGYCVQQRFEFEKTAAIHKKNMEKLQTQLAELEDALEDGGWVPKYGPSGKQKSPNMIRSAIRKYLIETGITQTEFLRRINVNSNSYNRFMTMKYKDEWSATDNGTYWGAAKFFAREDIESKIRTLEEKKAGLGAQKRKSDEISGSAVDTAPTVESSASKKPKKAETEQLLEAICDMDVPEDGPIYANCDEVRSWILKFQCQTGASDAAFLRAIKAQTNSLKAFRSFKGKGAGASNLVYPRSWRLMEQYRIYQKKPKSASHLEQERRWGKAGFPKHHDDGKRLVFMGVVEDPRIFDIEYCQDMRNKRDNAPNSPEDIRPARPVSTTAPAVATSVPLATSSSSSQSAKIAKNTAVASNPSTSVTKKLAGPAVAAAPAASQATPLSVVASPKPAAVKAKIVTGKSTVAASSPPITNFFKKG